MGRNTKRKKDREKKRQLDKSIARARRATMRDLSVPKEKNEHPIIDWGVSAVCSVCAFDTDDHDVMIQHIRNVYAEGGTCRIKQMVPPQMFLDLSRLDDNPELEKASEEEVELVRPGEYIDDHCASCGAAQLLTGEKCYCACHTWAHRRCECGGIRTLTMFTHNQGVLVVAQAICPRCAEPWTPDD